MSIQRTYFKIGNPKTLKTSYPCENNRSELHKIYRNKKYHLEEKTKLVDFNHPLYVLFSSGTTGLPKCITHGLEAHCYNT